MKMSLKYILMQSSFWFAYCGIYAFANSYLTERGFEPSGIGNILAIASLFSVFAQPFIARLIEKYEKITVRNSLMLSMFIIMLTTLIMPFITSKLILTLVYIVLVTSLLNAQTYMYTFIFEYINKGYNINFGLARGLGSVSFATASFFLGAIGSKIGFGFMPIMAAIISIIVIITIFTFDKIQDSVEVIEAENVDRNIKYFFNKYRQFCYIMIGLALVLMTHTLINSFALNILTGMSKGSREVGIGFMIAAGVELPIMYSMIYLNKKLGYVKLFRIFVITFVVKIFITLIAYMNSNIYLFYFAQFTQITGYAIYLPAAVYYTNDIMEPEDRVKGQAYVGVSSMVGAIIGSITGGYIIEQYSVGAMLIYGIIMGIIGLLIVFSNLKKEAETN